MLNMPDQGGLLHLHTAGHFDLEIGFGQSHAFIPAKIAAVEAEIIVIRIFPAAAGKGAVVFRPSSIHFTDIPGCLVGRQIAMDLHRFLHTVIEGGMDIQPEDIGFIPQDVIRAEQKELH